jgi:hypothetical protein
LTVVIDGMLSRNARAYDQAIMAVTRPGASPKRGLRRPELLASLSLAIDVGGAEERKDERWHHDPPPPRRA